MPVDLLKKQYNIDFVIEGGISIHETEIIIATRIISTTDDSIQLNQKNQFDTKNYQTTLIQIAKDICDAILTNSPEIEVQHQSEESQSQSYYLKGLHHWNRYTHEELNLAISYFKRAIKLNTNFAEAYAAIADCYCVMGVMGFEASKKAFQLSKYYVQKALQLNDKRSESFVSAALVNIYLSKDYAQAKINLSQAQLLNKENQMLHHVFAMFYIHTNKLDLAEKHALYNLKRSPNSVPYYHILANIYLYQKNFSKGLNIIKKALAIDNNSIELKELEGHLNMHLKNYEKAIECYQICHLKKPKHPLYYSNLVYIFSRSNYPADSQRIAEEMKQLTVNRQNVAPYYYAESINKLGQLDYNGFFKQIHKAIEHGLGIFIGDLVANPIYNEVRKDPRFANLLKQLGLASSPKQKIKKRLPASQLTIHSLTKDVFIVDPQHIAFIEAQGNYSKIYWFEDNILKNILLRCILGDIEKQLKKFEYIIRCHKSYLINLNEPMTISGNSKGYFFENHYFPIRIPISRKKAHTIIQKIKS